MLSRDGYYIKAKIKNQKSVLKPVSYIAIYKQFKIFSFGISLVKLSSADLLY